MISRRIGESPGIEAVIDEMTDVRGRCIPRIYMESGVIRAWHRNPSTRGDQHRIETIRPPRGLGTSKEVEQEPK